MARKDVLTNINIWSRRDECAYSVVGFSEYSVDADLETDSDQFHLVLENPDGIYSGIFNKYDTVSLYVMGKEIMHGRIDEVTYNGDVNANVIEIIGRDDMSILIDNDAMPCTLSNVDPVAYLKKKCLEYHLSINPNGYTPRVKSYGSIPVVTNVVIGTSQSEMSVLSNLVVDSKNRIWQDAEWLCIGDWQTNIPTEFYFTRGVSADIQGIPIKNIKMKDSGIGIKSEVLVYGTVGDDSDKEQVLGKAKNPSGTFADGIPRRQVMSSYSNDKNTKSSASAEKKIREAFRDSIELEITVNPQTMDVPVWINKTAHVVDTIIGIDATFFIKAVNYTKSATNGSSCTIKMIPDDATFEILWTSLGKKNAPKQYIVKKSTSVSKRTVVTDGNVTTTTTVTTRK